MACRLLLRFCLLAFCSVLFFLIARLRSLHRTVKHQSPTPHHYDYTIAPVPDDEHNIISILYVILVLRNIDTRFILYVRTQTAHMQQDIYREDQQSEMHHMHKPEEYCTGVVWDVVLT